MRRPSPGLRLHRRFPINGCEVTYLDVSAPRSGRDMNTLAPWATNARRDFVDALALFRPDEPVGIISHNDADGLASAAIITRSLERVGRASWVRILGRGENLWADATATELRASCAGGLI